MNQVKINKIIIILCAFVLSSILYLIPTILNSDNQKNINANAVEINLSDNVALRNYLEYFNAGKTFDSECFKDLKTLIFSGEKSNGITKINGLEKFLWNNLEKIEIDGLLKLEKIDLTGIINNNVVFPKLKEIVIKNVFSLKNVDLKENNLDSLKIINNTNIEKITFPNLNVCKNLEIANLNCVKNDLFSQDISLDNLTSIKLSKSNSIKNIIFSKTPKLEYMEVLNLDNLQICKIENSPLLKNFNLKNTINLESLIISNSPLLQTLNFDENEKENLKNIKKLSTTKLKTIIIKNNNHLTNLDISSSKNIETINLDDCANLEELTINEEVTSLSTLSLANLSRLKSNLNLQSNNCLQILNLYNCKLLTENFFKQLENFKNLEYLNLEKSSITNIRLIEFKHLNILKLGNDINLENIYLENIPLLDELSISNCNRLNKFIIKDALHLSKCSILNSKNINSIFITNTNVKGLEILSYPILTELNLSNNPNLKNLTIVDCKKMTNLLFNESINLEFLQLSDCPNLEPTCLNQISNKTKLNKIILESCPTLYSLNIKNCDNIQLIDIKNMFSLVEIKLNNINKSLAPLQLKLPKEYKRLKVLELIDLPNAIIENSEIICNNGILQKVFLKNLPIKKIDFSNNKIVNFSIKNIDSLQKIYLANNQISDFPKLIDELDDITYLSYANLNGNRLDLNNELNKKLYTRSKSKNLMVVGIQNISSGYNYTYYPKLYIGNFEENIKLIIYYTGSRIRNPNTNNIDTSNFFEVSYKQLSPFTLDTGTYIFKYYKIVDNNLENIVQGDAQFNNYQSLYCNVTKNRPWISYVWIIFFCVAGGVILFIIASFIYDKFKIRKSKNKNDFGETDSDLTEDFISDKQLEKENKMYKKGEKKRQKLEKKNLKFKEQSSQTTENSSIVQNKEKLNLNSNSSTLNSHSNSSPITKKQPSLKPQQSPRKATPKPPIPTLPKKNKNN